MRAVERLGYERSDFEHCSNCGRTLWERQMSNQQRGNSMSRRPLCPACNGFKDIRRKAQVQR